MEKRTRVFVTFLAVVFLISSLYIFTDWFSQVTGYFVGESDADKLAHCLQGKNSEFYGTTYCPDCEKTRELFGKSFKLIREVDCGRNLENCPNVREIPAWFIEDEIHYGYKNFSEIKTISGCMEELPSEQP